MVIASGSPSALRNRETCTCTVLTAPAGASSPHNATARRSALTGSFACNNNTANTARGLRPPSPTATALAACFKWPEYLKVHQSLSATLQRPAEG